VPKADEVAKGRGEGETRRKGEKLKRKMGDWGFSKFAVKLADQMQYRNETN
jgi:hypothetical protein